MLTRIATLVVASFYVATVAADEPKRLVELRQRFHALQRSTESDRVRYITALVRLRESFTRADYKKMEAIDAEIITHPIPPDVDSADLCKRIVGRWMSPRHSYLPRRRNLDHVTRVRGRISGDSRRVAHRRKQVFPERPRATTRATRQGRDSNHSDRHRFCLVHAYRVLFLYEERCCSMTLIYAYMNT